MRHLRILIAIIHPLCTTAHHQSGIYGLAFEVAVIIRLSPAASYGSFDHTRLRGADAADDAGMMPGMLDSRFTVSSGAVSEFECCEKLSRV